MKKMAVAVGAAALGGLVLAGGCSPSKVMDNRGYVPLEEESYTPLATESAPVAIAPAATTPAIAPAATEAKKAELPKFNSAAIKHTGPITSAAAVAAGGSYVVKSGDTLGGIAHANGISVRALMAANNMTEASARKLRIGQKLTIPAAGKAVKSASAKAVTAAKSTASTVAAAAATVENGAYTVKSGDSIAVIAKRLKVKQSELMAANNLTAESARKLQIGQKLKVPGATAAVAATVAAPDLTAPAAVDTMAPAVSTVPATTDSGIAPAGGMAASMPMDTSIGSSKPMEVEKDITLDEFAKQNKLGVDALKKLNPDIAPDGQLKAGDIIFVPES